MQRKKKDIFVKYRFGTSVMNSVFVAAVTVIAGVIVNALAGFAFAKFQFPCKRLLFGIVLITFMVPFELLSINLYSMMIDFGWVDTFFALIVPSVPNGMVIFLFRQYYLGFPDYLLETANVVGTPGSGFGPSGEGYFRLTAFGSYENTIAAIDRIRKL